MAAQENDKARYNSNSIAWAAQPPLSEKKPSTINLT